MTKRPTPRTSSTLETIWTGMPALLAVGTEAVQAGPTAITAPALTANGKPKVLYIGAEFCPYCLIVMVQAQAE
ncbi:hypothetical protein [Kribbella sp. NBC_00889]|uniref:hypothetical protein n=1 Tax=Kribbella sp. NBC_00889 TaxID=2975974 RepID=UPI00386C8006|nr:hypothetical protein OG817_13065 [Kribbella sp. NBC_00889]